MTEQVLLVGGGGREHAIARSLAQDPCEVYACSSNRNPGIARIASEFRQIEETNVDEVVSFAKSVEATVAIIGPETPLQAGVVDGLNAADIYAFGPPAELARIETDKSFQREFMADHAIPGCPDYAVFEDMEAACSYIDSSDVDLAVKPAGLTGGKGVKVIGDQVTAEEAKTYLRESSYERVVLEERLVGEEFTIQAFVANGEVRVTPAVQDHKRAYEGDEGPNTGGMGSYSAAGNVLPFLTEDDYEDATTIMEATVEALEGYRGILYGQFMATADGIKVVEFNARFGDPEAMNTLPVLETSLLEILIAARDGSPLPSIETTKQATVCKYAVPSGYPTNPSGGQKITIDESTVGDALLFYASVDEQDDEIFTTTSRSFALVGRAETIDEAESIVEEALEAGATSGLHIRHDIGTKALIQRRIDHMEALRNKPIQ